jgi:hypothetical protein
MTQVVSRRPLTAEAQVKSLSTMCGVDFLPVANGDG